MWIRLILALGLMVGRTAIAQVDSVPTHQWRDSVEMRYQVQLFDTLPELADSVISALRSRKFEAILRFIPTTDMIKEEFDSLDLEYLDRLATVKSQYMVNNLRKQHLKMVKLAKVQQLNLRNMEVVHHRYRQKIHEEGHEFGEVIYLCKSGSHEFYISFIVIKMIDKWFLADELRIEEKIDPQAIRKKSHRR